MAVDILNKKIGDAGRVRWLDISRGICICLVLLGHELTWDDQLRYVIYAFHIPMFFIMSGMTSSISGEFGKKWNAFVKINNNNILKPYFKLSVIYILWDFVSNVISGNIPFRRLILDMIQSFSGYGINVLWFLITLYYTKLLVYKILQYKKKPTLLMLITTVWGVLVFAFVNVVSPFIPSNTIGKIADYILVGLCRPWVIIPFVLFGYLSYKKIDNLMNKLKNFNLFSLAGGYSFCNISTNYIEI